VIRVCIRFWRGHQLLHRKSRHCLFAEIRFRGRYQGQSGHRFATQMSAFDLKADIGFADLL
jgi:hypothetical protein